jgi:hypothetical protein
MTWAPDYVTLVEQTHYARIDDDIDDAEIQVAITAASRAIDEHCNRQFGKVTVPTERLYTAWYDYERCRWVVDIDDLATAAGLVVAVADVGTVDSYDLEPVNAVADGKVWTRLSIKSDSTGTPTGAPNEISATATWGWPTVPVSVKQAAHLQTSRFLSRRDSPYGIAGSPDQGSELRLLSRVDPDVGVSLRGLRRPRRAG